jgi:uncharacterized protein YggE
MKSLSIACSATALLLASSAQAQIVELDQTNQPVIVVLGEGDASKPAEYADLRFGYRGEGKTQVEALQALKAQKDRVEAGLTSLAGATGIKIQPSQLKVATVWSKGCAGDEDRDPSTTRPGCAVEGYVATVSVSVDVSPAEVAGNAASLASQLGAVDVEVADGGVRSPAALEQAAAKAALADAQSKAEAIAAASGVRLGPILRVQDQRAGQLPGGAYQEVVVTGSRIMQPAVRLDFSPPPVSREAQLTVTYSILH